MNVTFTRIVINDDKELFVGSYAMDANNVRDLLEIREYAEEHGIRTLDIEAGWYHYGMSEEYDEAEAATDEDLEYISEHFEDEAFTDWLTELESQKFTVEYNEEDYDED